MRFMVVIALVLNLAACAHNGSSSTVAQWNTPKATFFVFETVKDSRTVNSEPAKPAGKKAKAAPAPKKAVAMFPCKPGDACQPKEADKKVVSYDQFKDHLKKATASNKNIFGQQEKALSRGLASLKDQKKFAQAEIAHFDWQIKHYRYASLRPVVENYKQAKVDLSKDVAQLDEKIKKYERDLEYLHNPNRLRMGMMEPADLLMEMIEGGQWAFGDYMATEDRVLWNFFQQVGQDLAKN